MKYACIVLILIGVSIIMASSERDKLKIKINALELNITHDEKQITDLQQKVIILNEAQAIMNGSWLILLESLRDEKEISPRLYEALVKRHNNKEKKCQK